jgi:hypothetical protein
MPGWSDVGAGGKCPADHEALRSKPVNCIYSTFWGFIFLNRSTVLIEMVHTIDYSCEDELSFLVTASCVTTSNPDSLPSSEKRVNPGIRN